MCAKTTLNLKSLQLFAMNLNETAQSLIPDLWAFAARLSLLISCLIALRRGSSYC